LRLPWIGCHGNHEELCQGVGVVTPEIAQAMVGGRKPIALGEGFNPANAVELFVTRPEAFMSGTTVAITLDAWRRPARLHHKHSRLRMARFAALSPMGTQTLLSRVPPLQFAPKGVLRSSRAPSRKMTARSAFRVCARERIT